MCKGCELTTKIEKMFRDEGMMSSNGFANFKTGEDFDAAINSTLNILSHIAASFEKRNHRDDFMNDVVSRFRHMTRDRVQGKPSDDIVHPEIKVTH